VQQYRKSETQENKMLQSGLFSYKGFLGQAHIGEAQNTTLTLRSLFGEYI